MPDITDLEIFAHVVRSGSLSAAARELNFSPAMISKRLARFEKRLGARLLHRTTRQLTMTDIGSAFYAKVQNILELMQEAEIEVSQDCRSIRGRLKVSAPVSFGRMHLAPHLKGFLDRYPELEVGLSLTDREVDIIEEKFDVAIRAGSLEDSSFIARRLSNDRQVFCAAPDYLAQHGEPRTLAELSGHRLLASCRQSTWKLDGPEGPCSYRVQSVVKTDSNDVVRETMTAGLGIAFMSVWEIVNKVRDGRVKIILPEYGGESGAAIYAVYPTRQLVAPKVHAFIDYMSRLYKTSAPLDLVQA